MSVVDIQALLAAPEAQTVDPEKRRELDAAVFLLEQKVHTLHQKAADTARDEKDRSADQKIWKAVQADAMGLMKDALDLRVAVLLAQSLLQREGFTGFSDGLLLIQGLIETRWEGLIPEEDESDPEDPFFERVNLLENLCEWQTAIKPLMAAPLCVSREIGRFSLRDVRIATGKKVELFILTEAEKANPPQLSAIQAACKQMAAEELDQRQATARILRECLDRIDTVLKQRLGEGKGPDFGPLGEVIAEVDDFYAHQISLREPPGVLSALKQSLGGKKRKAEADAPSASDEAPPQAGSKRMDTINSRQDVIRLLDQICMVYAQNEPASPVPLLLQRARKLVEKNFYEIMEDLAPKTATELKKLIGEPGDDNKA